eukprot:6733610-Prymnesium_polylepis.1
MTEACVTRTVCTKNANAPRQVRKERAPKRQDRDTKASAPTRQDKRQARVRVSLSDRDGETVMSDSE